jgi:hypothetical protein
MDETTPLVVRSNAGWGGASNKYAITHVVVSLCACAVVIASAIHYVMAANSFEFSEPPSLG